MEQFCRWGLFLMLESWEDASPHPEEDFSKPIFVPILGPLDTALEDARTQLYNEGLDADNFMKRTFNNKKRASKVPIAKRTRSKRSKQRDEESEGEPEEEQGSDDDDNGEEEEDEEEKHKKSQAVCHLIPHTGDRKCTNSQTGGVSAVRDSACEC